jgi:predicted dehydrogenase
MAVDPIRIGIVGANVNYGWGTRAHLPALAKLPEFEVRAVCTNHLDTAQETAKQFDIPLAFEGIDAMVAHPEVDLVVVCVRVPAHHELVMTALNAGKHVFCEWPLGANLQQAIEMRDTARAKGVVHAVGLQSRGAPVLNQARDLIKDGYVGELVSVALRSTGAGAGVRTPASTWMADVANGANTLTIQGGHAIDALRFCAGEFREVAGVVTTQLKESKISGTDEVIANTSPDNVAIGGILQNGAVASIHVQSVPVIGTGFLLEIHGTEGSLVVRSESSANTGELELRAARRGSTVLEPIALDEQYRWAPEVPSGPPLNVGQQYRRLAEAIRGAGEYEPNFDTAVDLHRLLDAMVASSSTGERQYL